VLLRNSSSDRFEANANLTIKDLDREDDIPTTITKAPFEEVFALKKKEDSERKTGDKKRHKELSALGFEPEHSGEILF
jgi:U6 snRNA-associated Sm-like protein LSm1